MTNMNRGGSGRLVKVKVLLPVEPEAASGKPEKSLVPLELLIRLPAGMKLVNSRSQLTDNATVIVELGMNISVRQLPAKTCVVCGRPFSWRRKWRRSWHQVKYCSRRCRNARHKRKKESADE